MKSFITKITQIAFLVTLLFAATQATADSFDPSPASGYSGTASISSCDGNCANRNNSISYGSIDSDGEFTVFINFKNDSPGTISSARGYINPEQWEGTSSSLDINTRLTGAGTESDSVRVTGLPNEWKLEFVYGEVYVDDRPNEQTGELCSDAFPELDIPRHRSHRQNADATSSSGAWDWSINI